MKRITLSLLVLSFAFVQHLSAQVIHRNDSIYDLKRERGYFQKAFVDPSDPRFMLSNDSQSFYFGIGGSISFSPYEDIFGTTADYEFRTYNIMVPTYQKSHFGYSIEGTFLYCKTRIKIGKQNLIGYVKIKANRENVIKLDMAYLSYFGFTVGRTYSLFRDLNAGIQTVDTRGVCSEVCGTRMMIAYQHDFGKNWTVGAAVEHPDFILPKAPKYDVDYALYNLDEHMVLFSADEFQPMPNIVLKGKYYGKHGHVQLSGIFRKLDYWSADNQTPISSAFSEGSDKSVLSYGLSLSGRYNFNKRLFATGQLVGGKGITSCINDVDDAGMDTYLDYTKEEFNPDGTFKTYSNKLKAHSSMAGFLGLQYQWNKSLTSSLVVGGMVLDKDNIYENYHSTGYVAGNLFWAINPYLRLGGEVVWGYRNNIYQADIYKQYGLSSQTGYATRLTFKVNYIF